MTPETIQSPAAHSESPAPAEAVVAVRGLTKIFKDFWGRPKARAVDNVSFEVRPGEVFGLLGPNGSGKSTTVKMLLGLLYPTRGQISVFGRSPRHVPTKARIGYLPEESYLYRYLNSRETIDFFGSLFEIPSRERRRRAEQLLEMVGLKNVQRRTVGEFSKGMQRRIGLAQALINDPDLIILDEPTSGMDPIGCREIKDLILALSRRGKTVILSSHLLADVEDVCDRVIIYYGGRIQAMGTMRELLAKPDRVRFTMPTLPREAMERVLAILRQETAGGEVKAEVPTQNLESFFLEVVQKAQLGEEATSGALSGSQVASYLRGEAGESPHETRDRILDRLTAPEAEPPATAPPVEPSQQPDYERLAGLTEAAPKPAAEPEQGESAGSGSQTEQELKEASEKLSSLLGDNKGSEKREPPPPPENAPEAKTRQSTNDPHPPNESSGGPDPKQ